MGRPPIGKIAMTAAERVRRHRLKRGPVTKRAAETASAAAARLAEENRRLAAELAAAMERIQAFRNERKRRTAPKPAPPTPDEARDRQLKGLKTANASLRAKLRYMEQHYQDAIASAGGMPRKTKNVIDMVLHPDTRNNATEADKDLACKLWNSWKDDQKKVRPR